MHKVWVFVQSYGCYIGKALVYVYMYCRGRATGSAYVELPVLYRQICKANQRLQCWQSCGYEYRERYWCCVGRDTSTVMAEPKSLSMFNYR